MKDIPAMRVLAWPDNACENPYNRLLYGELSALGIEVVGFTPRQLLRRPATIWHLHWVEDMWNRQSVVRSAFRATTILAMLQFARLRGTKIIWTVHNLHTHERSHPRLERWFWSTFIPRLDGYLALTSVGMTLAQQHFPALRRRPGFVVPHGHYLDAYPATVSQHEARDRLGIPPDARVVTFLGKVRPYKNVPHLIRIFRTLSDPELRLLIAGKPNLHRLEVDIRSAACGDPRIQLRLHHIPDEEVQVFMRAADLVVLPYVDVLNSGSALLALSFDRPVLVPDRGAMGELAERAGLDWVRTFPDSLSAAALEEAVRWAQGARGRVCEGLQALSWRQIARKTLSAFECILRGTGPAAEGEPALAPVDG